MGSELMRDVAKRRGVAKVVADIQKVARLDEKSFGASSLAAVVRRRRSARMRKAASWSDHLAPFPRARLAT